MSTRIAIAFILYATMITASPFEAKSEAMKDAPWQSYSWGWYYKEKALRSKNASERRELLEKAIGHFTSSMRAGASDANAHLQISECLYHLRDYKGSIDHAKLSIKADPASMRPYHRIYIIYMKLRKYGEAADVLEEYLKVKPNDVQVQFALAEHYLKRMNDPAKSAACFQKVIDLAGRTPVDDYYREQSYLNLAAIHYRSGDAQNAIDLYEEALKVNRESMEALFYLALVRMEIYDLEGAETCARRYLERRPDDKAINGVIGRILYLKGDLAALHYLGKARHVGSIGGLLSLGLYAELTGRDELAEKVLTSINSFVPRTISIHLALGRIAERKNNPEAAFNEYVTAAMLMYQYRLYDHALRSFNAALAINDTVPGVSYYLGRIYEETGWSALAIHHYSRAYRLKPDPDLLIHIGYLYGLRKDYASAMRCFNATLEQNPKNSRPHFFMGLISLWQEDYQSADRHIQRAITLDDKVETYHFYHAVVLEKLSRVDGAIASLQRAIQLDPKSARAYNFLGYIYADRNMKIDESLALIRKALSLEPRNGAYIDSLGWAFFRKGEYEKALKELLTAEEILGKENSPDPVVYDHIGDTYLKLGKVEEAVRYWKKSVRMKQNEEIEKKIRKYEEKK